MIGSFSVQAFGMPSSGEWIVLLVIGLLIFGRRLPEVGKSVARTVSQFRRGLHDFKRELDKDEDLKEVKSTVHEFKRAMDEPRIIAHPRRILDAIDEEDDPSPRPEVPPEPEEVEPSVEKKDQG